MPRPPVEVADVIRAAGGSFFEHRLKWFTWLHLKVLNAILRCRTAALGGHVDACSGCGHQAVSFNSCRNRHCPRCQANARDRWLEAREKDLLPTRYVHVVFTLPGQLSPLALQNKREIYSLLFQASAETLLQIAGDPKRLGAEIGFFSVLHSERPTHQERARSQERCAGVSMVDEASHLWPATRLVPVGGQNGERPHDLAAAGPPRERRQQSGAAHAKSTDENEPPVSQRDHGYHGGQRSGDYYRNSERRARSLEAGGSETRDGQGQPGRGGAQPGGELARRPVVGTPASGGELPFCAPPDARMRPAVGEIFSQFADTNSGEAPSAQRCDSGSRPTDQEDAETQKNQAQPTDRGPGDGTKTDLWGGSHLDRRDRCHRGANDPIGDRYRHEWI